MTMTIAMISTRTTAPTTERAMGSVGTVPSVTLTRDNIHGRDTYIGGEEG